MGKAGWKAVTRGPRHPALPGGPSQTGRPTRSPGGSWWDVNHRPRSLDSPRHKDVNAFPTKITQIEIHTFTASNSLSWSTLRTALRPPFPAVLPRPGRAARRARPGAARPRLSPSPAGASGPSPRRPAGRPRNAPRRGARGHWLTQLLRFLKIIRYLLYFVLIIGINTFRVAKFHWSGNQD